MRLSLLSLSSLLGFVPLGSSGMGNSLSTLISAAPPKLLRDEDPLSKLNTEVFRDACGTPGTGEVGECVSRELVDFEAAVETCWRYDGG